MKYFLITLTSIVAFGTTSAQSTEPPKLHAFGQMKILRPDAMDSNPAPSEFFTGNVRLTPLVKVQEPSTLSSGYVTFQPGARSRWHTHPKGQLLIVTGGSGLIQEWGKPPHKIQKGDVVWTPPGVNHWHGASPSTAMTHTSVTENVDGKNVDWLEEVSDKEYREPAQ